MAVETGSVLYDCENPTFELKQNGGSDSIIFMQVHGGIATIHRGFNSLTNPSVKLGKDQIQSLSVLCYEIPEGGISSDVRDSFILYEGNISGRPFRGGLLHTMPDLLRRIIGFGDTLKQDLERR